MDCVINCVVNTCDRLVIVDNVSVGLCGAYPAWLSGLPAGRIKDDRRSG